MTKLRHIDNLGTARFVTFTCYRQHRYLTTPLSKDILLLGLAHLRSAAHIRILGWVLMPEHVHLVLLPPARCSLGRVIGSLKSWTSRQILNAPTFGGQVLRRSDGSRAVWERRCYDHNCRTPEKVREKIEYCHANPARRGLVASQGDWRWSSYNWYRGGGQIVLDIDGYEM